MSDERKSNREYFQGLEVLWLLDQVREIFPGSKLTLKDKQTGKVIKGTIGKKPK